MLLGQDLGRRHHRRLIAGLDRGEHGQCGHDRLAGADVALEQPVHRVGRGHVGADLRPHPLLGAGERPRQRRAQTAHERARRVQRDAASPGRARAQDGQAELEQQEVLEGQPADGRPPLALAVWEVRAPQRDRKADEVAPAPEGLGQCLGDVGGVRLDEPPLQRAQRALGQPLRGGVDRHQRAGMDGLVVGGVDDLPVLHLQRDLVLEAGALAVQDHALPALQDAREPAAAKQGRSAVATGVAQQQHQRGPPAAGRRRADPRDRARAGRHLAHLQAAHRGQPGPVLVADRQEEQRLLDRRQPLAGQELGALGTDALEVLQLGGQARRRQQPRGLPHRGHCAKKSFRLGCP